MVYHPLHPYVGPHPLHAHMNTHPLLLPSVLVSLRPSRKVGEDGKGHHEDVKYLGEGGHLAPSVMANQDAIERLNSIVAKLVDCHSGKDCSFDEENTGFPSSSSNIFGNPPSLLTQPLLQNQPMHLAQPMSFPMMMMPMPYAMPYPFMYQQPQALTKLDPNGVTFDTEVKEYGPRYPPSEDKLGALFAHVAKPEELVKAPSPEGHTYLTPPPGELPWLVSIQVTNFERVWVHLCGGTLIAPAWVLTAAHCLDTERLNELVVVAGEHDLEAEEGTEQKLLVEAAYKHPDYEHSERPMSNDIALIKLREGVDLSQGLSVATLPEQNTAQWSHSKGMCKEGGWGPVKDNSPGARVVKVSEVPVWGRKECATAYNVTLGDTVLCAGSEGVGACAGDNGGPLMCTWEGERVVAGVMSWREGCALPGKPAVYMDVSQYVSWITQVMEEKEE